MKKSKKFIFSFLFILILSGAIFYLGWVQFKIPLNHIGILKSKTSGVLETPIQNGIFTWRWEPLIPTNSELYIFPLKTYTYEKNISGTLTSGEIYAQMLNEKLDFSYSFDIEITLSVTPETILNKVKSGEITSSEALEKFLDESAENISRLLASELIKDTSEDTEPVSQLKISDRTMEYIRKNISDSIIIANTFVKKAKLPDYNIYKITKNSYEKFQARLDEELSIAAKQHAENMVENNKTANRLEQIGIILQKYKELSEVLKVTDAAEMLKKFDE